LVKGCILFIIKYQNYMKYIIIQQQGFSAIEM
jgi:hypothetical protein